MSKTTSEFRRSMYDQFSSAVHRRKDRKIQARGLSVLGIVSEEQRYHHLMKDKRGRLVNGGRWKYEKSNSLGNSDTLEAR